MSGVESGPDEEPDPQFGVFGAAILQHLSDAAGIEIGFHGVEGFFDLGLVFLEMGQKILGGDG